MAKLNANTVVVDGYSTVVLMAGDEIPEWAADQVGDHLIEPDEDAKGRRKRAGADS